MGCRTCELLEQARVRRHFRMVVAELRQSDTSDLTAEQRAAREAILDEVEHYGQLGRFPKNTHTPDTLAPTFIDEDGTRCAVAHLLESTGEIRLAARIAREHNRARVPALASFVDLASWLARSGLSIAEAARIQPSYCRITPASCFCGDVSGATGILEGTIISKDPDVVSVQLRIDAIHGDVGDLGGSAELTLMQRPEVGTVVFVPVYLQGGASVVGRAITMSPQGNYKSCWSTSIQLDASTARDAMLAEVEAAGGCEGLLESIDPGYVEDSCRDDGGCSVAAGSEPLLVGGVLLARLLARRRRLQT